ncbi:hypothetical protein Tco_1190081 [Tanacetum coccineum]
MTTFGSWSWLSQLFRFHRTHPRRECEDSDWNELSYLVLALSPTHYPTTSTFLQLSTYNTTMTPIEIPTVVPTVLPTVPPPTPDHTPALLDITHGSLDYSPASDTESDPSEDPS